LEHMEEVSQGMTS